MWSKYRKWLVGKFYNDARVQKEYVLAGKTVGDALSYAYMGEIEGMKDMVERWAEWELEYASRGYRTISLDDFIQAGGYGLSLDDKIGIKREKDEQPVPHSLIYMKGYPQGPTPVVDLNALMQPGVSNMQMGTYSLPSTTKEEPK